MAFDQNHDADIYDTSCLFLMDEISFMNISFGHNINQPETRVIFYPPPQVLAPGPHKTF